MNTELNYCKDCDYFRTLIHHIPRGYVRRPTYKFSCFLHNRYIEEYDTPCRNFKPYANTIAELKELMNK